MESRIFTRGRTLTFFLYSRVLSRERKVSSQLLDFWNLINGVIHFVALESCILSKEMEVFFQSQSGSFIESVREWCIFLFF